MAYSKQTWVRGEKVASVKLNHMEDGIEAISANGAIDTANLAPAAVTNDKLDQEAVDSNNIRTGSIITPLIYDGAVTIPKLGADVIEELDHKADIDGSYESMTVGNAEQLISSVGIEDSTPYNFRTTGGSADVGDRMNLKAVVGGTVAWNQNLKEVNSTNWVATAASTTVSITGGVATVTAGSQYAGLINANVNRPTFQSGHKMFYNVAVKLTTAVANAIRVKINDQDQKSASPSTAWQTISGFFTWDSTKAATFRIIDYRASDRDAYQVKEPMLIDLTAMFGSTIADYVYTLESGTAGAGVAWLKKYGFFTKPYYPYKAAALESVKTSAHKTYGFNAYNPSTGKAKVVGGMVYQITGAYTALSLDGTSITPDANGYFTPSANGELTVTGGNSTTTCIHLKWDGERDGEWEEFSEHTYALDDVELRGILKLDANNNLYADGDRYLPDGTVERRAVEIEVTSCVNVAVASTGAKYATYSLEKSTIAESESNNFVSNGYAFRTSAPSDGGRWFRISALTLYIFDERFTDKATADSILASEKPHFVYITATPTTETASPYQQTQIVDDFGTEEFVDAAVETGERDVAIPVWNETVYKANLRAKLEMAPDSPDGDGDYIVRQSNGQNSYIPLVEVKELPDMPSSDGNYTLRCTVTNGTATLSWVSA